MNSLERHDDRHISTIHSQFEQAAIKSDWTHSRKLHTENIPFYHSEPGYSEMLPTYQSKNLEQLIQLKIDQSPDNSIRLIDCGCNRRSPFLVSCVENWRGRGRIIGDGITAQKVTRDDEISLASKDISIIEGDIHFVDEIIGDNVADIIVSNFCAPYLFDPWFAVTAMNRSLKFGGIGLVNYIPFGALVLDGENKIYDFTTRLNTIEGVESTIHKKVLPNTVSLSWEKRDDAIPIGLSYGGYTIHTTLTCTPIPFEIDQMAYAME